MLPNTTDKDEPSRLSKALELNEPLATAYMEIVPIRFLVDKCVLSCQFLEENVATSF